MDIVTVLIYDSPEYTSIPLATRANWIRTLYPTVNVIEAVDGPTEVGDSPEIRQRHEDYVIHRLGITGITHFYSSEFYGEHMAQALGAINRIVDPDRVSIDVSGTRIRSDPFAYRTYVEDLVYRDLITNVVFLGAPSTGKTTIAARLAEEYDTVWMPEYGREYWELHQSNRRLSLEQLEEIAIEHLRREEQLLLNARRYMFTDTNAITTYLFSLKYHQKATDGLIRLARQAARRYDLVIVCDTDIPYDNTWDRSGDFDREQFQDRTIEDLTNRKVLFSTVSGGLDDRVKQVIEILRGYPSK